MFGIDATSTSNHAALKRDGVNFCARYLSPTPWKNLSATEASALRQAGIAIVTVFESTGQTVKRGRAAGITDARLAQSQLQGLGKPNEPVYFAVDYDLQPHEYTLLEAYLGGAASVLGFNRTGLYAGYGPCKAASLAGWCKWIWQTYAWSNGLWVKGCHLKQYSNGHKLSGVDCDFDVAMFRNYGQWDPPRIPVAKPKPKFSVRVLDGTGQVMKVWTTSAPALSLARWNVARHSPPQVVIDNLR